MQLHSTLFCETPEWLQGLENVTKTSLGKVIIKLNQKMV